MGTQTRNRSRFQLLGSITALLVVALAGCHREEGESDPGAVTSAPDSGSPGAPSSEEAIASWGRSLRELKGELDRSTEAPAKKLERLRLFISNLKADEKRLGKAIPTLAQAEAEMESRRKALDEDAAAAVAKLEADTGKLLDGATPDLQKARALIGEFPEARYQGSAALAKVKALRDRADLIDSAQGDAASRLEKAKSLEDPVKVIALLEGLDPRFDGTPPAVEVRRVIEENYRKFVESRSVKAAQAEKADWRDLSLESHRILWPDATPWIAMKEGVLEIGPNSKELAEQENPDLRKAAGTCIRLGEDDWYDVEIQFEAKLTEPAGIFFGAHGAERQGLYNFNWLGVEGLKTEGDDWHRILVRIDGASMLVTDVTGQKSVETNRIDSRAGPFGIRVTGAAAILRLRNLQVWIKTRMNAEGLVVAASDEPKETGKKDKKGGKKKSGGGTKDGKKDEKKVPPGEGKTGEGKTGDGKKSG